MLFESRSLEQTQRIGASIAEALDFPSCVYLEGDLGAGKTTLCQSIIHSLGYQGAVTSPTYNLIQEYRVNSGLVYHMDLYRLHNPDEVEYLALPDLWSNKSLFLIEWPVRGGALLPSATHTITISDQAGETQSYKQIEFIGV